MDIRVEHLQLKRLEQKIWQFKDYEPKRVELAVLDYLNSEGWHGYFTEHFDYDKTLLCMMCWCNRDSYFNEKRKTSEIFKHKDSLWYAFNHASDGFFDFNRHKFSHSDLLAHASNFSEDKISSILQVWRDRNLKSAVVGRSYLDSRPAGELDANKLISFYQARGGLKYYFDYINYFYDREIQELKNSARILDGLLKEKYGHDAPIRNLLIKNDGNYLRIYKKDPPQPAALKKWIEEIESHESFELKDNLIQLAQAIKKYWFEKSLEHNPWRTIAALDLKIWKNSIASVEVKAPNDRLRPNQKEQLELDISQGKASWVIEVDSA